MFCVESRSITCLSADEAAVRGAARRSELAGAELAQKDGGEWPLQRGVRGPSPGEC